MKVVAFNGSARKGRKHGVSGANGFEELENQGIRTELIQLAGQEIHGCTACMRCFFEKKPAVRREKRRPQRLHPRWPAEGVILASPTYFANVSPEMKALIDVAGMVSIANDAMLRRKVGAGVVAVRRGGAIGAFDAMNHFFLISQMIVPGSSYWNMGFGMEKGEAAGDSGNRHHEDPRAKHDLADEKSLPLIGIRAIRAGRSAGLPDGWDFWN